MSLQPEFEAYALERRALMGEILYLRTVLADNGIDAEHPSVAFSRANEKMVTAAADFLSAADDLRRTYGTSVELLNAKPWR